MSTRNLDGKAVAARLKQSLTEDVNRIKRAHGITPGIAFVLVGEDPASHYYIQAKARTCAALGIASHDQKLATQTTQAALLTVIDKLAHDPAIHGILVQLPLPAHIDPAVILAAIPPQKDVDGFHPVNAGRLASGDTSGLIACTPLGSLKLIQHALGTDLRGKHAVVLGRSTIVGRPMAQLLLSADCTVTLCHSHTPDPAALTRQADIVVAAVGRPGMVTGDWIRPGATVIDVGINRIAGEDGGKDRLVGDVEPESVGEKAAYLTPVPGGVGPMTISCLMHNTVRAACQQHGIADEDAHPRPYV